MVGYHFSSRLTATLNLCMIYLKITWALAILLEHMHKKFEINHTKIKGGCQSGRKMVTQNSKSDLALASAHSSERSQNDLLRGSNWALVDLNRFTVGKKIELAQKKISRITYVECDEPLAGICTRLLRPRTDFDLAWKALLNLAKI